MQRVAVIGAGPAGLVALRHLAAKPELYTPVAYERSGIIGGTWVYTDETGYDKNGLPVHSSMYKNLMTNTPKEISHFSDFPFPDHLPSYVRHVDVLKYLQDYTDHHKLQQYVRFDSLVSKVTPRLDGTGAVQWEIKVRNVSNAALDSDNCISEIFDAVFVCVGHCSVPRIPDIKGLDQFCGKIIHSHDYRVPEVFQGMRVVTLGAAISGQDISLEIAKVAKEVMISHNGPRLNLPPVSNMRQVVGIDRVTCTSAIMKDGKEYEMDALILCTGYKQSYPFLDSECHISVEERHVHPLYKHLCHCEFPSLAIIGVCEAYLSFPHFEVQVKFVLSVWEGVHKLPTVKEIEADNQRMYEQHLALGNKPHRPHFLGHILGRSYENELAVLGKFNPLPKIHYDTNDLTFQYIATGLRECKGIDLPKTPSGVTDLEKLARFPVYVSKLRAGLIDKATKF